jgi:hypothetical protein
MLRELFNDLARDTGFLGNLSEASDVLEVIHVILADELNNSSPVLLLNKHVHEGPKVKVDPRDVRRSILVRVNDEHGGTVNGQIENSDGIRVPLEDTMILGIDDEEDAVAP